MYLVIVLSFIAVALLMTLHHHFYPQQPLASAEHHASIEALLKEVEAASLIAGLGHEEAGLDHQGQNAATAQLDPELRLALVEFLKRPQLLGADGSTWQYALLALVVIAAIGAVAYVAKSHAETVPVAGVAALATEAIKNADHLSKLPDCLYLQLLRAFFCISLVLLSLFVVYAFRALKNRNTLPAAAAGDGTGENKTETYLSSLGFSVLVLVWAAVVVCYKNVPEGKGPTTATTPKEAKNFTVVPEAPPVFKKGLSVEAEPFNSKKLLNGLSKIYKETSPRGDILLLLGSTDCTPFRPGVEQTNKTLAEARSRTIADTLKPFEEKGLQISRQALPQHARCREAEDLRAVYPLLIQSTENEH